MRGFGHVDTWIFDLDNTLYPASCRLFDQIDVRMGEFVSNLLGVSYAEAKLRQKELFYKYGTTLRGLMVEHGVALCPTVAAGHATSQYSGWRPGQDPEPQGIQRKRASFKAALDAGVTIASGSDVGVFTHGDNAREIELMVQYGMNPVDALRSATSVDAKVLHMETQIGKVAQGLQADLIGVEGDPTKDISVLHKVKLDIPSKRAQPCSAAPSARTPPSARRLRRIALASDPGRSGWPSWSPS